MDEREYEENRNRKGFKEFRKVSSDDLLQEKFQAQLKSEAVVDTLFQEMLPKFQENPDQSQSQIDEDFKEYSARENILSQRGQILHLGSPEEQKSPSKRVKASKLESGDPKKAPGTKEKLKKLFEMYSDISEETGEWRMKSLKWKKLIKEAGLLDNRKGVTKSELEIIYSSNSKKKGLTVQTFLTCVLQVGKLKFPSLAVESEGVALKKIIISYLLPLYDKHTIPLPHDSSHLHNISPTTSQHIYYRIQYDQEVKLLLNSLYASLKEIYTIYFIGPFKRARSLKQVKQMTSKQILAFLHDFDLSPYPLSKQTALLMLQALMNLQTNQLTANTQNTDVFIRICDNKGNEINQNAGTYFTFDRMFIFILWASVIGFDLLRDDKHMYSNAEKVFQTLTKMELSHGFINIQRKTLKPYTPSSTLIPEPHLLAKIIRNNPIDKKEIVECVEGHLEKERDLEKEMLALDLYLDKIQRLFMWYCSVGDNLNANKMPATKFLKLMKDCKIVKVNQGPTKVQSEAVFTPLSRIQQHQSTRKENFLTPIEVEIIFAKIISTVNEKGFELEDEMLTSPMRNPKLKNLFVEKYTKQGRLDFESFIFGLSIIAGRIYPHLASDQALLTLVEKHILTLYERNEDLEKGSDLIQEMLKMLEDSDMKDLLGTVHKIMINSYNAYSNHRRLMTYDMFMKFARDFAIFPDLCSKTVLHRTFYGLALINNRINYQNLETGTQGMSVSVSMTRVETNDETLDEHLFIEALAFCSLQSKAFETDAKPIEKILHLMEKMLQSSGISKVRLMSGKTRLAGGDVDPLLLLKKSYPQYFEKRQKRTAQQIFDDAFQGLDDELD